MFNVWQDVKYGCRVLGRSPVFTVTAMGILALGIGGSAAIFTLVYHLLWKPLPYEEPSRLVRVYETFGKGGALGSVSAPNLLDWRAQSGSFAGIFAYQNASRNLQDAMAPERVDAVEMEPEGFGVLGARALRGRTLVREDRDQPAVVISEGMWRQKFGADEKLIGKRIVLDGKATLVVGVMPAEFAFPPQSQYVSSLWAPLGLNEIERKSRGSHSLAVVARLKEGVSFEQAEQEMRLIGARLEREYPNEQSLRSVALRPLMTDGMDRLKKLLWTLFGAVGVVFLIACINVANLLLVRAARRGREVAIRVALGGGRAALIRQFLIESLILSVGGAVLGSLVAYWGLDVLKELGEDFLPRRHTIAMDGPVLMFLVSVSVLGGLLFGLIPAIRGTAGDLNVVLKSAAGRAVVTGGSSRLRMVLVAGEVALSLILLAGAGLLMRTLLNLQAQDLGFRAESLLTMRLAISETQYPGRRQVAAFFDRLVERVKAVPGAQNAGLIQLLPLQSYGWNGDFEIAGRPKPKPGQFPFAEYRFVSPEYFATMGVPLVRGRELRRQEPDKPGAVLINQTLARRYFPNEDPVGQRLMLNGPEGIPVVGVVADSRQWTLDEPPHAEIYIPAHYAPVRTMSLVVRTSLAPEQMAESVRRAIREIDPNQPVWLVKTMKQVVRESVAQQDKLFQLMLGLAVLAVILASAGIWGVISYLVEQRMAEFGVRMALGATGRDLLRLVMKDALGMILPGVVVGVAGAFALSRLIEGFLFGVKAADPVTLLAVTGLLMVMALAAVLGPAWRALRLDPMVALRWE